jgi:metal-responsive CopG/Arc/MetJ family transcriptional regulator
MTDKTNMVQFGLRLDPKLLERLEMESAKRGLHRSEIIRAALDRALPLVSDQEAAHVN